MEKFEFTSASNNCQFGQVMKTANAPDNLIPGAKPMPTELAKRLMPEEGGEAKLSKKQKKKMASKVSFHCWMHS